MILSCPPQFGQCPRLISTPRLSSRAPGETPHSRPSPAPLMADSDQPAVPQGAVIGYQGAR